MSVALVTVVSGEAYERYARGLFDSAFEFFRPDLVVAHIALPGVEGWPEATLLRYHVLLGSSRVFNGFDHIFLCDADMRFEAPVGREILAPLTVTLHPGFVGRPVKDLPFERSPKSAAYVGLRSGLRYYAGGFIGGERLIFLDFAASVAASIELDQRNGYVAVWHDESYMNQAMNHEDPTVLSPAYCYPDDASGYDMRGCERKLVALDKTPAERRGR